MKTPSSRQGSLVIVASSVCFALLAVETRVLSAKLPAAELSTIRFAVGLLAMGLHFVVRRRGPDLRHWGLLLARGTLGGLAVLTYFVAIERLGAAPATVLNYVSPVYTAVFAMLFLKERAGVATLVGLVLGTLGAALVTLSTASSFSLSALEPGALAGLASGAFGGAAMAVIKVLRRDTEASTVFTAFCFMGLALSAPLAAPHWVPLEGTRFWLALLLGALSLAGQLLFTWGMGFTTATTGSAITQLVPALAWVLALGWLHESVNRLSIAGALLCISGVLLGLFRPGRD